MNGIIETDVTITTSDGICDAAFFHPENGVHPGVLIWSDAFGLRPALREVARRTAAEGYSVLAPNPFYRVAKDPFKTAADFDFQNPAERAKIQPLMASAKAPGNAEKDTAAFVAFLDSRNEVDKTRKIGVQGYCMGGTLMMRTAAALPERIGAGASFHGGGLVTANPDSPHLLASKIKARLCFGVAASDDEREPEAKVRLKEALDSAGVRAEIEVYEGTQHGWCMPDTEAWNPVQAERALSQLFALYKTALA